MGLLGTGGDGNISPPPIDKQGKYWVFTYNNFDKIGKMGQWELISISSKNDWKIMFSIETGECGTKHLQGFLECSKKTRWSRLNNAFKSEIYFDRAIGNYKQNLNYITKSGQIEYTSFDKYHGMTTSEIANLMVRSSYTDVVWKPWQQAVLDIFKNEPDTRSINWFYEYSGNVGKTFLSKYIYCNFEGVIICGGKSNDIFNQVKTCLETRLPTIVILDIPRTNLEYINYQSIEKLKDGLLYSGKYEGGVCCFPSPHVVVFANEPPDTYKMSKDRWNIVELEVDT